MEMGREKRERESYVSRPPARSGDLARTAESKLPSPGTSFPYLHGRELNCLPWSLSLQPSCVSHRLLGLSPARKTEGVSEQTVLDSKAGSAHPPPWPMTLSSRLQRPRGESRGSHVLGERQDTSHISCTQNTHICIYAHATHHAHIHTQRAHLTYIHMPHAIPIHHTNMRGHNTHLPYATRMPHTTYTSHIHMPYDTHTHHACMHTHKSHRCCMAHTHQIHMCTHKTHVTYMSHTCHTYMQHTPHATHTHTRIYPDTPHSPPIRATQHTHHPHNTHKWPHATHTSYTCIHITHTHHIHLTHTHAHTQA